MIEQLDEVNVNVDDEFTATFFILKTTLAAAQVTEYVKENYPATFCAHAGDCCGNWYSRGGGDIVFIDLDLGLVVVKQYFHQNV